MVKIYLRSIVKDEKNCLALFDSNHGGDINKLITKAPAGDTIIWKLDYCSGIKSITRIYSKEKEHRIFKSDPVKRLFCKGFKVQLLETAKEGEEEQYVIECVLIDNTKVIIDPNIYMSYIRVPPPPPIPHTVTKHNDRLKQNV